MNELFLGFNYVQAYIDDLLVITKGQYNDHLTHLDRVLEELEQAGLKINSAKSCFVAHELEYLGYWISRDRIQPMVAKVDVIKNMATPKNRKALQSFIGLINYYCDMWRCKSELLDPLIKITSNKNPFCKNIKRLSTRLKNISCKTLLFYIPNFDKPFGIHTDARDLQLGAVISLQ